MKTVVITQQAYDLVAAHSEGGIGIAPHGVPAGPGVVQVELDEDIIEALESLAPDTGDAVHDISEAIKTACLQQWGTA